MIKQSLCALLLACAHHGAAEAAPDVPGNKNTKAELRTGTTESSGNLFGIGDADWYRVMLDRGYNYGFNVQADCPVTELRVLDRSGRELGKSQGYYDFPAFLERVAAYSGLHFVAVKSLGAGNDCESGGAGAFGVRVFKECGVGRDTLCKLPVGGSVDSEITAYQDKDWWKLSLPEAGTYTFKLVNAYGGDFLHDIVLSLRRANGSIITESRGYQDVYQCLPRGTAGSCLSGPLPAGTSYIAVRGPENEGGSRYRLTLKAGK